MFTVGELPDNDGIDYRYSPLTASRAITLTTLVSAIDTRKQEGNSKRNAMQYRGAGYKKERANQPRGFSGAIGRSLVFKSGPRLQLVTHFTFRFSVSAKNSGAFESRDFPRTRSAAIIRALILWPASFRRSLECNRVATPEVESVRRVAGR